MSDTRFGRLNWWQLQRIGKAALPKYDTSHTYAVRSKHMGYFCSVGSQPVTCLCYLCAITSPPSCFVTFKNDGGRLRFLPKPIKQPLFLSVCFFRFMQNFYLVSK